MNLKHSGNKRKENFDSPLLAYHLREGVIFVDSDDLPESIHHNDLRISIRMNKLRPSALLVLENGLVLRGRAFGAIDAEATGEVVFNTSMTGYQEILSDPSYYGQILTFTYPHQGNVGVNTFDMESERPQAAGMVAREISRMRSNWRSDESLESWLEKAGIIGIDGVDTRMLVRALRTEGSMRGIISARTKDHAELLERVQAHPRMTGLDLTSYVTTNEIYTFEPLDKSGYLIPSTIENSATPFNVVVIDFGVKRNILERLAAHGCRLTVVPSNTSATEILALEPDGVFLSNGPGDPGATTAGIETVRDLVGKVPLFGICLGHQLLALALGAKTFKLKFGHRGSNHPVQQISTGANEITAQNHGFAVDLDSMDALPVDLTHVNLNDRTVEGFRHREHPLFCVQYHPEAGPGPHDADYLFGEFVEMMAAETTRTLS